MVKARTGESRSCGVFEARRVTLFISDSTDMALHRNITCKSLIPCSFKFSEHVISTTWLSLCHILENFLW